jgi:hypothetical protein
MVIDQRQNSRTCMRGFERTAMKTPPIPMVQVFSNRRNASVYLVVKRAASLRFRAWKLLQQADPQGGFILP